MGSPSFWQSFHFILFFAVWLKQTIMAADLYDELLLCLWVLGSVCFWGDSVTATHLYLFLPEPCARLSFQQLSGSSIFGAARWGLDQAWFDWAVCVSETLRLHSGLASSRRNRGPIILSLPAVPLSATWKHSVFLNWLDLRLKRKTCLGPDKAIKSYSLGQKFTWAHLLQGYNNLGILIIHCGQSFEG